MEPYLELLALCFHFRVLLFCKSLLCGVKKTMVTHQRGNLRRGSSGRGTSGHKGFGGFGGDGFINLILVFVHGPVDEWETRIL